MEDMNKIVAAIGPRGIAWLGTEDVVLMTRGSAEGGFAFGGFRWPIESGVGVQPEKWVPDAKCGNGLHGFLWGEGNGRLAQWGADSVWHLLAARADDVIELGGGKVKAGACWVVAVGSREEVLAVAAKLMPGRVLVGGTSTSGDGGTSTSGDGGTSTSGDGGTSTSGDEGTSTSGDGGTSTSGDGGTSTSGDGGTSTSGDEGTSTSGYRGTSTSGDRGTSTSGYGGTSTSGDEGTSTSGYGGTSTSGDRGTSTSGYGGTSTSGYGGLATAGRRARGAAVAIHYWENGKRRVVAGDERHGVHPGAWYVARNGVLDVEDRYQAAHGVREQGWMRARGLA